MVMDQNTVATFIEKPAALLQQLIRFDTTNPPGNEKPCIEYIAKLLNTAGFETTLLAKDPERPNLLTRLKGRGDAPPLLMYAHVDVVSTAGQKWRHPPFEGRLVEGNIWGRGALDMKSGLTMMLTALLRARADGLKPAGDIILAVLSDEEAGGNYGADFLVSHHPGWFDKVRYAIGEFGGFTMYSDGIKFYPIMVAEKHFCWMRGTIRGAGGHGAVPMHGGAMAKLAAILSRLDTKGLPVHITPVAKMMINALAEKLTFPKNKILKGLLYPALTDPILKIMGREGKLFYPLLRNTVNVTMVRGGDKVNVIPSEIVIHLDGRLLPGFDVGDILRELETIVGDELNLEVENYTPGPAEPDMGLFATLSRIIKTLDPVGEPIPLLLAGTTDARHFTRLGIQTYGFIPMSLPPDFHFTQFIHAADERIPEKAVDFGANAVYSLFEYYQQ